MHPTEYPADHWNSTYIDPVTKKSMAVSNLGDPHTSMPPLHDPTFQKITDDALAAFRVTLTKHTLGMRWKVLQATRGDFHVGTVEDLAKWWPEYLKSNPSLYAT